MSNSQAVLLTILGFFTVIGLNLIAWTFLPRARRSMANRLERSIGLAIPDSLRSIVGHRLARTRRMNLAGTIIGAWAAVPLVWPSSGVERFSTTNTLLLVGLSFAGGSIGTAISSVRWPARRYPETIRYARPRAVGLADYVAPIERVGTWVAVGLSALIILFSAIIPAKNVTVFGPQSMLSWVWIALAVITLCFFEVVGRRIVSRAQPSGSEAELVWEDALRATDARGLATAPITIGMYGILMGGFDAVFKLGATMENTASTILLSGSAVVGIALMFAILIYALVTRPERFFLKRLWPQYFDLGASSTITSGDETTDAKS